ncbi:hypothetical protein A3860_17040 [Niastella vici]|uniref:Methylamine utilisation protein MauE domain-containing protein n=1 Tax=Niastella vici TaxID=1703345 RepID=A0A1V9G475_9BACT|nr:MauE/DoxX family redox-associated membrane protein [Niastella vici]OQP65372.1 hypothetical protein A3860_17040 [Niastella vici]
MKPSKLNTFTEAITILFVILFLYTGISKLMDYTVFKEQIATSPILAPVSRWIAAALPWMEFAIVILLAIPKWRLKGLYASFIIMILFTGYIISMLTFNKDIPCSCGGVIELLSWNQHIIFNTVFILLAAIAIAIEKRINNDKKRTMAFITEPNN